MGGYPQARDEVSLVESLNSPVTMAFTRFGLRFPWILTTEVPHLLAEPGIGPISGAAIYLAWSHHGRIRNDAAFAALAGVAPIPASSGQTTRHRLNRGGDRQLNRALHTITLSRLSCHPETRTYATRRLAEGKTTREIRRCLKRHLARRIYKLLENTP